MTSVTDPTGGKVTTSYDEVGRTTSTKDANGNTTRYTYDGVVLSTRAKEIINNNKNSSKQIVLKEGKFKHNTLICFEGQNAMTNANSFRNLLIKNCQ